MPISTTRAFAYASDAVTNSVIAIESAGLFTATQLDLAQRARITCATNPITFRYDGGDPDANSHYMAVGSEVEIVGNANVKSLKFIRATGSNGRVSITLEGD